MKWIERLRKSAFVGNFTAIALLQGSNYLLHFLSFPYLFRVLGDSRFGQVAFGYATIQYLVMLTDFGFSLSGTKYISQHQNEKAAVNRFLNSAMTGRLFLCLCNLLLLLLLITFVGKFRSDPLFYLLYFGIVLGNWMFPIWFFQGIEKMKYITIINLAAKSLSLLPMFFFIRQPEQYIYVPVCYSTGYLVAGAASLYFIYHKFRMRCFLTTWRELWLAMKDSATYFLSRVSLSLYSTTNTFVLGLVAGDALTGCYAAAEKLYQAYGTLVDPFTKVLFPYMSRTRDTRFFKRSLGFVLAGNTLLLAFVFLFSHDIIALFYHPFDPRILQVFRILMLASIFAIPHMLVGYPLIAAMGHPKYANWTVILTSCFHITCMGLMLVFGGIGIYSVATLVVCSELLLALLRFYGIKRFKLFRPSPPEN
jgi:PST family polysaccharide transporter